MPSSRTPHIPVSITATEICSNNKNNQLDQCKIRNKYYYLFLQKNHSITSSDIRISMRHLSKHMGK